MGGNAFKHCTIKRKSKAEYLKFEANVIKILSKYFKCYGVPKYFPDKESFGDLDILYVPNESFDILKIRHELQSKECVKNGNIISIEHDDFQIDLIRTIESEIELFHTYLSWSNFGKLIGIICSQYNLSFGHLGLYLIIHFDDKSQQKLLLSEDHISIFKFLGLNYDVFNEGFSTELEMFEYVKTCNLYRDWILLDPKNNRFPKKRKETFGRFGKTIDGDSIKSKKLDERKETCKKALEFFNKMNEHNEIIKEYKYHKVIKSKFNGVIINEITGLKHQKLGKFMEYLRGTDGFMDFIHDNDLERIKAKINLLFNVYDE